MTRRIFGSRTATGVALAAFAATAVADTGYSAR